MTTKTSYAFNDLNGTMERKGRTQHEQQMSYRGGHMSSSQSSADTHPSAGHKSSSLDSDNDVRNVQHPFTLHLVTDPGYSGQVSRSYQNLIACMDRGLSGIVQVCERQEAWSRKKSDDTENKTPRIPSLALILFCYDHPSPSQHYDVIEPPQRRATTTRDKGSDDADTDSAFYDYEQQHPEQKLATYAELRRRLTKRPWTFHHKVNISGSMMLCDSNVQDFYRYEEPKSNNNPTNEKKEDFPLFAVRKVHTGRPVLRATIFVSSRKWREQIAFYARLSGCKATPVRDDFCLLDLDSSGRVQLQLGLKKLPEGLKPKSLTSTFIEFDVTNVDMIALTPNVLEPMSELRMRTRDHDGNTVILSLDERVRREMEAKTMASSGRLGRQNVTATRRSRSVSPYVNNNIRSNNQTDNAIYFTNSPKNGSRRPANDSNQESMSVGGTLTRPGREKTRRSSNRQFLDTRQMASYGDQGSPKPTSKTRRRVNNELDQNKLYTRLKPKANDKKSPDVPNGNSSIGRRNKLSSTFATSLTSANDSFTYPCLPERMPLLKQDAYVTLQGSKDFGSGGSNRFTQDSSSSKDDSSSRRSQLMSSTSSISSSSAGGKKSLSVRLNEGFYV